MLSDFPDISISFTNIFKLKLLLNIRSFRSNKIGISKETPNRLPLWSRLLLEKFRVA